nr:hypothetical protein [Tanacetum cinerariifolium]
MTYYSLWEVILNGDSPAPTRVIEGVVQPVAPTTAEQKLVRKNELKARGTLLMALPDKHQLKFNIHKDAKTLMEAIKKRLQKLISQLEIFGESLSQEDINLKFLKSLPTEWRTHTPIWRNKTDLEEQSLDDLFNSLKIYKAEVKSSSSASTPTQNIAFVSSSNTNSTNDSVSAAASVSDEMDLNWQMAMLTMKARRFLQRTGRILGANGPTSMRFNMSKVECYNCHRKRHFARECRSSKDTRRNGAAEPQRRNVLVETSTSNALVTQCDGVGSYGWSFQAEEEPTNYALMAFTSSRLESAEARLLVYQQNVTVFEEDIKLLKLEVQLRDNALVVLRQKLEKAEQERDDLKLKLEKYKLGDGYHVVPLPYTGTFMPLKPDLVFHDAPNVNETAHTAFNVELSPTKPDTNLSHTQRPSAPIIEDWVSNSEDDFEAKISQNVPSFIQPIEQVKTPRTSIKTIETSIPTANPKTAIPKPKSNGNRRNRNACFVCKSLDHLIKDCDFYEKKMAQTHSKLVPIPAARPVTAAVPKPNVTRPRPSKPIVTKPHSPPRRHINRSPSPKATNFSPKVTAVQVPQVNAAKGVHGKWEWKPKCPILDHGNPQHALKDKGVIDSGCSRHMTGNMSYLSDFEELNGRYVAFGDNPKGGKISGKGKIRTGKLDFDDVYFVKELKFNLFSVSQMCDKKNNVLFTDTECLVLSPEFKLPDENQVLLRAEAVNTACYVQNRVLVTKPQNKTPYKLLLGRAPSVGFMRPFGCPVTILNTLDPLGKFDRKVDEGFLVRYSVSSKAFRNTDGDAAFKVKEPEFEGRKPESEVYVSPSSSAQSKKHDDKTKREAKGKSPVESSIRYRNLSAEFEVFSDNSINVVNDADSQVPAVGQISTNSTKTFSAVELEDITYSDDEEDVGADADFTNLEITIVSHILTTRVHKDHPVTQFIGDLSLATQTRSMSRVAQYQSRLSQINNDDFHTCMFACFLSQEKPKRVHQALKDPSWIEAMQDELLQFKMQKEEVYVYQPPGFEDPDHHDNVYKVVVVVLVDVDVLMLIDFLSMLMLCVVIISDVVNVLKMMVFCFSSVDVDVGVTRGSHSVELTVSTRFTKTVRLAVVKALYGLHQAPRAWYETLANYLLENDFQKGKIDQTLFIKRQKGDILLVQIYVDDIIFGPTNKVLCKAFEKLMKDKFQMSSMGELTFFLGLQVKQKPDGIFISHDKYVVEILRKFGLMDGKSASTPIDTEKPLLKDPDGEDIDVHTYRSIIGSLMYLTSSRPDIMFAVCACDHFQVTPKASHLHAAKRIFRYLKGKPHLGWWYPKDLPFNLVAYSDSDYAGASLDKKSTIGGCLGNAKSKQLLPLHPLRLIKKVNDVSRLQALADRKKEIFTELARMGYENPSTKLTFYKAFFSSQWKFLIHTILQCMSAKRTLWNEFSSSMASAVICLSTCRKFNFSKKQVGDLSSYTTKYSSPSLTHKVFANMRRVGKGCSRIETPLFEGMIVAQQVGEGAAKVNVEDVSTVGVAASAADDEVPATIDEPSIPSPLPTQLPPPSQYIPSTSQVKPTPPLSPIAQPPSPQHQPQPSHDAGFSMDLLQNLLDICTTLTRRVEHLEQDKITQALEITKLQQRVKKLERRNKASKLRRLKKVGTTQRIDTSDDTVLDDVSKHGRIIADMDVDMDVTLKDVAVVAKYVQDAKIEESLDVQGRQAESQAQIYQIDFEHADKVLSMQDVDIEPTELQEVVTNTKLITKVVTAASATITAVVPTLTTAPSAARRRKGVVIRDPEETATPSTIIHTEPKSKDKGKWIMVHEPKPLKKQA